MSKRKTHTPIQKGDEILADIYQKLCDIEDKIGDTEEQPDNKVELKEPEPQPKPENISGDKIICDICGKEFKTERGLKAHKTKIHGSNV